MLKIYNVSYQIVNINCFGRFAHQTNEEIKTLEDYNKLIKDIEEHLLKSVKYSFNREHIWISSITLL